MERDRGHRVVVVLGCEQKYGEVLAAIYDTCPRQEVSGNRGDPGVGVLCGTKSVLI